MSLAPTENGEAVDGKDFPAGKDTPGFDSVKEVVYSGSIRGTGNPKKYQSY